MIRFLFLALCAGSAMLASSAEAGDYCREYRKQIKVGSRVQEAYGTACMQPDGSWEIVSEGGRPYRDGEVYDSYGQPTYTFVERPVYTPPLMFSSIIFSDDDDNHHHRHHRGCNHGHGYGHRKHHNKHYSHHHGHHDDGLSFVFNW